MRVEVVGVVPRLPERIKDAVDWLDQAIRAADQNAPEQPWPTCCHRRGSGSRLTSPVTTQLLRRKRKRPCGWQPGACRKLW